MKTVKINIRSDLFHQIKPSRLPRLQELIEGGSRHSLCNLIGVGSSSSFPSSSPRSADPTNSGEVWAAHYLTFTNQQVYNLLTKALSIVGDSEEHIAYQLNQTFGDNKNKNYSTPPGTVRIYDHDLICFYNGKTWRKLQL